MGAFLVKCALYEFLHNVLANASVSISIFLVVHISI